MAIKIALPKGRLLRKTAALLQRADWGLDEYHSEMGFYRPRSRRFPEAVIRVFHEKDIPIQIAMGNYDLAICGLDWVRELLVKYPASELVVVKDLGYGRDRLVMVAASPLASLKKKDGPVRIASEYPNLAEAYALQERFQRFSIFPLWGAAEAYLPENADMVLLPAGSCLPVDGMAIVADVLDYGAYLIANRDSWQGKDLDRIVTSICEVALESERRPHAVRTTEKMAGDSQYVNIDQNTVWLALPDGHQQQPTVKLLEKAGITVADYPSPSGNRRPRIGMDGVVAKVIRPQDMPLQVANGYFDLAITGRDWLVDHLEQFPSSPVTELLDLNFARVRIVAVVGRDLPVEDGAGLRRLAAARETPLRVASEYVHLADSYARNNLLGHYRVIPTWGASEAFLPEDADLLIENTETGRTIARHNLKIIDILLVSTGCLIGRRVACNTPEKEKRIQEIIGRLRVAVA